MKPANPRKKRMLIALLFWLGAAGICVILLLRPEGSGFGLACPVHALTGLYCPGCGASRALASLLRGDLYAAFRWNPLLVVLLPFAVLYLVWGTVSGIRYGYNTLDRKIPEKLLWVLVGVLLVYFVLRNIPCEPFTWLRPTQV